MSRRLLAVACALSLFFGAAYVTEAQVRIQRGLATISSSVTFSGSGGQNIGSTSARGGAVYVQDLDLGAAGEMVFNGRSRVKSLADGHAQFLNNARARSLSFQLGTTPTVASGFGTSPSITAGSVASAGSVNVGTGGTATQGVVAFGETWPQAPVCVATNATTTAANTRALGTSATTTQLTITAATAWAASTVVNWFCVSST
jgi:hypothetical protein